MLFTYIKAKLVVLIFIDRTAIFLVYKLIDFSLTCSSYIMLGFYAIIFSFLITIADGCFTSGVCQHCIPMPQPSCSTGCSTGYSCGHYGCYSRARARSSKTLKKIGSFEVNFDFDLNFFMK